MGQSDVIKLLEKTEKPLSVGEIAKLLKDDQKKVSKDLNKMLQYREVDFLEIDRFEAQKNYNCKHRMRLWFTRGFFMATVDLASGKIMGCEKGSPTYYHELAHIKFNDTEWGARIDYWQYFFMMMAVFFVALGLAISSQYVLIFGFFNALGMVLSYLFQEVWAWAWGLKQYYKIKKAKANQI